MWALITAAWAGCQALQGGQVFDGHHLSRADVVVVDGRIAAVGMPISGLSGATYKGRDCELHELDSSAVLTPGFIDPWTHLGVSEVGLESATVDSQGSGDPIRASLRVTEAYNPASIYIPIYRAAGITGALVIPGDGRVSGQAGWVRLSGSTQASAVVEPSVALVANLGGESRAQSLQELRELIQDARAYQANRGAVDGNRYRSFVEGASRSDLEALAAVARGEVPLIVQADRAADIEALIRLADEQRIRLVIQGAAEAWKHAEALAAAKIPVILTPMVVGPGSFDQVHARPDNAKLLDQAGVGVMLRSAHNYNAPALRFAAGNAVRGGLEHDSALAALTSAPAAAFGLDDRGTIAPGQVADLVLWSADPLEIGTRVLLVLIDGELQSLDNRHKALFERYRELPGSPVPALSVR